MRLWPLLSALLLLSAPTPVLADDFDFGETFDEEPSGLGLPVRGKLALGSGYQLGEPQKLVSLDTTASLILDWSGDWGRLAGEGDFEVNAAHWLEDRSDYTIEHYTFVALLRSLHYSYAWDSVSIQAGQLMTVWSAGDLLPVLDVLTALDTTEGFFARPEQYRLGQVGTKLDFYSGDHTLSLVWHAWPQMNRIVQGDHPYSLFPPELSAAGIRVDLSPEWDPNDIAARWTLRTRGGEVTLMGGRVFERNPILTLDLTTPTGVTVSYQAYEFVGIAWTQTAGSVLLKSEIFWSPEAPVQTMGQPLPQSSETFKGMLGLDYNHESLGTVIVEANVVHTGDGGWNTPDGTTASGALMWSNRFWRDQLSLSLVGIVFGDLDNRIFRASIDYQVLDELALNAQGTLIDYEDFPAFQAWDRVDLSLVWSWDLSH